MTSSLFPIRDKKNEKCIAKLLLSTHFGQKQKIYTLCNIALDIFTNMVNDDRYKVAHVNVYLAQTTKYKEYQ